MRVMTLFPLLALCWCADPAVAVDIGAAAPAIASHDLRTAAPVELTALKGKVLLVDFWASWCAPCLHSLPLYEKLRSEFAANDFEIVAISVDEDAADAQRFLEQHAVSYAVVHDLGGVLAQAYAPPGMPTAYLIDREGVIRSRHIGFKPADIDGLREEIKALAEVKHAP